MIYYSTNNPDETTDLYGAVTRGLAPDGGLYMPRHISMLPQEFYNEIHLMSFPEIAYTVADALFGEDIDAAGLKALVEDSLDFGCPIVKVSEGIYSLELFHGPTLAFKDVGARFMARMLQYFLRRRVSNDMVNVLVATSGDTGSAVANGFLGLEGIRVFVLYPKGKVSAIQEAQFTTLGRNITAIEVDGTFDDCQRLVKQAFNDSELNSRMTLTSANSINVARLLPQAFYYFNAYAQLQAAGITDDMVVAVPSGNFGNIMAAMLAKRMGLPIKRFIAANNSNDVFLQYLATAQFTPRASVSTIANAMDVGNPSNFARILDLYGGRYEAISADVTAVAYTDEQIAEAMRKCYAATGYVLDPHGACGWQALQQNLRPGEAGVFAETAHPAKFKTTVDDILSISRPIPSRLQAFMSGTKQTVELTPSYPSFRSFLLSV